MIDSKIYMLIALVFSLIPLSLSANETPVLLNDVHMTQTGANPYILMHFEKNADGVSIQKKTLDNYTQIQISPAYTLQSSRFIEGDGLFIKKIFLLQATPSIVVIRLMPGPKFNSESLSILQKGAYIRATFADLPSGVPPLLPQQKMATEIKRQKPTLQHILFDESLRSRIFTIGIFIAGFVLLSVFARTWLARRGVCIQQNETFEKVSTFQIDAKRSLLLIKVEGKQVLLGITPEQISLLPWESSASPLPSEHTLGQLKPKERGLSEKQNFTERIPKTTVPRPVSAVRPTSSIATLQRVISAIGSKTKDYQATLAKTKKPVVATDDNQTTREETIANTRANKKRPVIDLELTDAILNEESQVSQSLTKPAASNNPYLKFENYVHTSADNNTIKDSQEAISDVTEIIRNKLSSMKSNV